MRKPAIYFLFIIVVLWSCKDKKKEVAAPAGPPPALEVDAIVAKSQSVNADVEVPGTLLAYESTEVHPEISGRLVQLNVKEGRTVSKGALLAKLYDGDLQAQMRKINVQLKIAEQTEKRQAELLAIEGISRQEYDLSLLQVNSLKADQDIIREAIRKTEIRAPFSGKLGLKNVSPGAYVTPATVLTSINQVDRLKLQFNVPEKYGSQLKSGLLVQFTVDGSPKVFRASVLASELSIEEETRSLAIRAIVNQKDPVLIPGTFAKVSIVLGESVDAIMIPNSAVLPVGRKKQVFVYKGGKSVPVDIITGVRDSTNLQVLEGLSVGDTVITSAILYLRPQGNVNIKQIN